MVGVTREGSHREHTGAGDGGSGGRRLPTGDTDGDLEPRGAAYQRQLGQP